MNIEMQLKQKRLLLDDLVTARTGKDLAAAAQSGADAERKRCLDVVGRVCNNAFRPDGAAADLGDQALMESVDIVIRSEIENA